MKCSQCAQQEATVHYAIIKDRETKVRVLCDLCADALSLAETGRPLDMLASKDLALLDQQPALEDQSPVWPWLVLGSLLFIAIAVLLSWA